MEVEVKVTQSDIDNGVKNNCYSCPIALAIDRVVGRFHVSVNALSAKVGLWEGWWNTSSQQSRFIESYDKGYRVEPFSFTLDIPERYLRNV